MRPAFLRLSPLFFVTSVFLQSGCQTYDFEPVTPLALSQAGQHYTVSAQGLHPDLMLLVDRSASMGYTDCAGCPTRLTQLKSAMSSFLSTYATSARIGFVAFAGSTGGVCGPASLEDITNIGVPLPLSDNDSDLQAAASAASTAINKLVAVGGTPTAQSLSTLSTYTPLTASDPNRQKLVLLLTDGLPNCNDLTPESRCIHGPQTPSNPAPLCTSTNVDDCDYLLHQSTCARNIVDDFVALRAVQSLQDRKVDTVVVGFGADVAVTNANAQTAAQISGVLNELADVSTNYRRACPNGTDAECNVGVSAPSPTLDGCNTATKLCRKEFYSATNGDALGQALTTIVNRIAHPCAWALADAPSDPTLLGVLVNGVSIASGADTWSYDAATQQVVFADAGAICKELKASTEANPVKLQFEVVNPL